MDDTTQISSGDGAGLLAFTDWLYDKNEMKPATAKALKAAVMRVLAVDDELLTTPVSNFDLDQILTRFENGTRAEFTSSSMDTYKSRFRRVVEIYNLYLAGDSSWRATLKPRNSSRVQRSSRAALQETPAGKGAAEAPNPAGDAGSPRQFVDYNLPLRPGLMVQLKLPADLTRSDAARIAAFVGSLAFDDSGGMRPSEQPTDEGD